MSILEDFKAAIEKFFPPIGVGMVVSGRIAVRGVMDIRYMARVEWIRRFKDSKGKFDVTNPTHVDLLKEVFLSLGADWRIDKWLREWQPPNEHHCYSATRDVSA